MTVMQNILSALIAHHKKGTSFFSPYWKDAGLVAEAEKILDSLGLLSFAHVPTTQLSYGDKRLVEIGIVLANYPRLILLDEPTAGMTPEETERMITLIHRLAEETDTTFFLTEHDMKVVFSVSQKIYVLHQGRLLAEGTPEGIRENTQAKRPISEGVSVLRLGKIHSYYGDSHVLQGVSLFIGEDESVCLLGRNGAGKSTTMKSIMGFVPPREGKIYFKDEEITGLPPFEIVRRGIGYVPEDRRIFPDLTVMENLEVAFIKKGGKFVEMGHANYFGDVSVAS